MATAFIQKPAPLSLLGNLPDIKIATDDDVAVTLSSGGEEILSQRYTPGQDGVVTIDIKDVLTPQLSFTLTDSSIPYRQESIVKTFSLTAGTASCEFTVLRAGVDHLSDSAENFLRRNFLTWQPNIKPVTYNTPEFLSYYAIDATVIKCQAYIPQENGEPVEANILTLANIPAGEAWTIPVQYAIIAGKLGNTLPSYYDIWAETTAGSRLTYIQRYYASDMHSEQEQWILFENSLGGVDTFRAYGNENHHAQHTHNLVEIDETSKEYRVDTTREFQKNSGHLNRKERLWLQDFFPSLGKYIYIDNYLRRIVMTESDVSFTAKELPSQFTFTFRFADAKPYLNLPRTDRPSRILDIQIPDVGSFTLAPRLAELDRLPLSAGALFPVQSPYAEAWCVTTAAAIVDYVIEKLAESYHGDGSVGHSHSNIALLNSLSRRDRYLLIDAVKIYAGRADEAYTLTEDSPVWGCFLRKDQDDETQHSLGMRNAIIREIAEVAGQLVLDGTDVGSEKKILTTQGSVDSMVNGHGTFLTNKDRLQTTNLEVRGSMTVMDLIINQLHAMEGDYYFSDVGAIERVVTIDENANSYRLYLKKETETSIITLREGDILWSVANNLRSHKTTDASFYVHPSWMLANAIDQDHFFIDVTLYDDAQLGIEVGTTNFAPEAGFNLVRRGNASARLDSSKAERARVWHISNTEGMMAFLDYLYSPVVGDESYQTTIGRLPDIQVLRNWFDARNLGSPSNHIGVYTQYLFAEHFLQIDWMGRVISTKNYRGEWSLATAQSATEYYKVDKTYTEGDDGQGHERPMTAYLTDTVTHMGVEWGCNRTGTTEEPSWYSADWIMIGGANEWDVTLHKDDSPVPRMKQQKFEMGIFFRVSFNGYDVTDKVMAQGGHSVTWARTTDDAALDNTWNTVGILQCYRDAAHTSLLLKNDPTNNRYDFGQNFRSYRHASFNATVVIPMATGENKTISKTYNFM